MKSFFSCDWGTSSFRLWLVNAESGSVLAEIKTGNGIALTFEAWKQSGGMDNDRISFYQAYLFEHVQKIAANYKSDSTDSPIVLSGMASSSIGMLELPYTELPFRCDGAGLIVHTIEKGKHQPYKMIFIAGVKSEMDAMRGEETILVGCDIATIESEEIFIFPGTHSKHVTVKNGLVERVTTYMTGELFDLLSNKSILSASVKRDESGFNAANQYFSDGVIEGSSANILNSIFHVRINQLFKKATAEANYHYLSGLLIGQELKDIVANTPAAITLVCNGRLKEIYAVGLEILGLKTEVQFKNADEAFINGQRKIIRQAVY